MEPVEALTLLKYSRESREEAHTQEDATRLSDRLTEQETERNAQYAPSFLLTQAFWSLSL